MREGKIGFPVAAGQGVEEYAAHAARFGPVGEVKIIVAPFFVSLIVGHIMGLAGGAQCLVKIYGVGVGLVAPGVEHRGQVATAAKPRSGGDHHARVHVGARDVGVLRVGDQRYAAGPEARVFFGTRDLAAKLRRKLAIDLRDMNPDFLEHPARHQRHGAAAQIFCVAALPRCALKTTRRLIGQGPGVGLLDLLHRRADAGLQS